MKQNKTTLPLIIFLSIAIGFSIGRFVYKSENIFYTQNKEYRNLRALINIVEENYADQINVFNFLKEALMIKLKTIDPYISFYEATEYDNVKNEINGEFEGIGIRYFIYNDTVLVSDVFPNSPAERGGIKKLDKIISFNNQSTCGLSIDSISTLFSNDDNPTISTISFLNQLQKNINIEKGTIQFNTVKYFYCGKNTAYFKVTAFHSNTYDFFKEAAEELTSKYIIDNIILDLRDNPGGLLSSAIDILDDFFEKGDTLTVTETKTGSQEIYLSTANGMFKKANVIILINGSTASAAELVTLAMQDNDRALVIGTKSYGKGVFQQDIPFVRGDIVHLTKGKYYGPSGRWIDTQSDKLYNFKFYKTKGGRYVAAQNAIVPDIYNYGSNNDFLYGIFDEYCLEFIFKYKNKFRNITNEQELLTIANSIVDTGGVKIYKEYFDKDSLVVKTLAFSFAKYLLPDSTYLHFTKQIDSVYLNAIKIFETSSVYDEIFKTDTLQPYIFFMD
ncbi:MAG: PDZ domain-containing protein [Bacteroidales bacterium]|nr:PDZ domain-containing protein [Bacteroidales bacterium]